MRFLNAVFSVFRFGSASSVSAPGYAFLSDEPTARASVFDSRMGIATVSDAIVGRSEVADGGS